MQFYLYTYEFSLDTYEFEKSAFPVIIMGTTILTAVMDDVKRKYLFITNPTLEWASMKGNLRQRQTEM